MLTRRQKGILAVWLAVWLTATYTPAGTLKQHILAFLSLRQQLIEQGY